MLATVENDAKAEPPISDELAGELMSIHDDLNGLGATFQMVIEGMNVDAVFKACADSKALNFLAMSLGQITVELEKFIERNCEGGRSN